MAAVLEDKRQLEWFKVVMVWFARLIERMVDADDEQGLKVLRDSVNQLVDAGYETMALKESQLVNPPGGGVHPSAR